ncbi:hypothetical protein BB560_000552 [Smittium megazygosporum]|uniref:MYND-type domain-containing protein n=1 Tax=Smittium megazygosporum TaxID=133381 RepID=A0A2T9ZK30_9FUNG|nr:hypothetical protein BB560_000552 [Smittium megazygosporum]
MRESNFNFPMTNKACVSISSALYDRRALDCTAVLPLVNSLWNLGYLTLSSARIREIMTTDGGLERLVRILRTSKISKDPKETHKTWKWLMAYHCVINIGVRGTEQVRKRVVQTGAISIIVKILEAYFKKMEVVDIGKQINQIKNITNNTSLLSKGSFGAPLERLENPPINDLYSSNSLSQIGTFEQENNSITAQLPPNRSAPMDSQFEAMYSQNPNITTTNTISENSHSFSSLNPQFNNPDLTTNTSISIPTTSRPPVLNQTPFPVDGNPQIGDPSLQPFSSLSNAVQVTTNSLSNHPFEHNRLEILQMQYEQAQKELQAIDDVMFRPEDVVLALQLLAYVSKYPEVRKALHCVTLSTPTPGPDPKSIKREVDVFSLVERFTFRNNLQHMQGWAGIIMMNMCRKDEKQGGIRKCANVLCPKWETTSQPFAKCRRCRKAKYCSKECQSIAWASGHKNWCSERPGAYENTDSNVSVSNSSSIPDELSRLAVPTSQARANLTYQNLSQRVSRSQNGPPLYAPYHISRNQNNISQNANLNNGQNPQPGPIRDYRSAGVSNSNIAPGTFNRVQRRSRGLQQFSPRDYPSPSSSRLNANLPPVNFDGGERGNTPVSLPPIIDPRSNQNPMLHMNRQDNPTFQGTRVMPNFTVDSNHFNAPNYNTPPSRTIPNAQRSALERIDNRNAYSNIPIAPNLNQNNFSGSFRSNFHGGLR